VRLSYVTEGSGLEAELPRSFWANPEKVDLQAWAIVTITSGEDGAM